MYHSARRCRCHISSCKPYAIMLNATAPLVLWSMLFLAAIWRKYFKETNTYHCFHWLQFVFQWIDTYTSEPSLVFFGRLFLRSYTFAARILETQKNVWINQQLNELIHDQKVRKKEYKCVYVHVYVRGHTDPRITMQTYTLWPFPFWRVSFFVHIHLQSAGESPRTVDTATGGQISFSSFGGQLERGHLQEQRGGEVTLIPGKIRREQVRPR